MPPSSMRALKTALEQRTFDRVYLFHGDDDYLKDEKVRALIQGATDPSTREFNLDVRRGGEVDGAALGLLLDSLPLMAERRVLVLRDVTALRKDANAVLAKYLERPAAGMMLVLVAPAGAKLDAALSTVATTVEFKPLRDDDLGKWAVHHAATGNDLALLAGELEKLRSFTNGAEIDDAAVEAVVGVRHGETLGDLLDLVGQRNSASALGLLERGLALPKTTGVSIVMALTTQTLAIGWLLAAQERGLARHQYERELYALLKENPSSLVGRPWGDAVKAWVQAARCWDRAAVDRAVALLLAADMALKDTKVSTERQLLTSLLLAMASGAPRRAAA